MAAELDVRSNILLWKIQYHYYHYNDIILPKGRNFCENKGSKLAYFTEFNFEIWQVYGLKTVKIDFAKSDQIREIKFCENFFGEDFFPYGNFNVIFRFYSLSLSNWWEMNGYSNITEISIEMTLVA